MGSLRGFDQKRCVAAAPDATAHGAAARSGDQGTSRTGVDEALRDGGELPHKVPRGEYCSSVEGAGRGGEVAPRKAGGPGRGPLGGPGAAGAVAGGHGAE